MGRGRPGGDRAELWPSPRWGGGTEVVRPPPSDSGTQCSQPGLALPCPACRLSSGAGGRVRSGPRGPLGGEAPDKGGAGAGAGGGVGEGSGSEPPTPRGGRQGRTLPWGLRGLGRPPGGAAALAHCSSLRSPRCSGRVGSTQRGQKGRGGVVHTVGLASGDRGCWTHPGDSPVSSSRACQA